MGNPEHGLHGQGPLGVGATFPRDGRRQNVDPNASRETAISKKPPAPDTTRYLRVYFGWARGRPALYEYEPQTHWFWGQLDKPFKRKRKLSFKTKRKRDWYEVGDLVLYEETAEWRLVDRYPELAPPPGEKESAVASLAMGLLLGPPDDLKLAHKITKITPRAAGKGEIELTPILILDDKTFIELEKRAVRTQLELSGWWGANKIAESLLSVMRPVAKIFYECSMAMATGGVGAAGRGAARRAALFTLRRARRHVASRMVARKLVVYLAKDTGKATVAGTAAFCRDFATVYRARSRQQRTGKVERDPFRNALIKGAGSFAASFISTLLGVKLDRVIKRADYGPVREAIANRIIQSFAGGIPEVFIKAISTAAAAETNKRGTFASTLESELLKELKAHFSSMVTADFKLIGESLANR